MAISLVLRFIGARHSALLENPHRVGKQLRPPLDDRHSALRGTYRVLYRIDDARRLMTVVGVFGRADDYRPAPLRSLSQADG